MSFSLDNMWSTVVYHGALIFSLTFFNLNGATISKVLEKMVLKLLVISFSSSVCLGSLTEQMR